MRSDDIGRGIARAPEPGVTAAVSVASRFPTPAEGSRRAIRRRYQTAELIGRGGMGDVVAVHDLHVGREVAVKRMRTPSDAIAKHRF